MIQEERTIDVFCDIHGHFQPLGGFMYCNTYNKDQLTKQSEYEKDAIVRVVPSLLSYQNEYFSFKHSTFTMEQYKAGSCRQAMFTDMKIVNSFTLENSFFMKNDRAICCGNDNEQPPSPQKKIEEPTEME